MLQSKMETVRAIGLSVNSLELRGAEHFARSVALMGSVVEAKKRHNLGPNFAAEALCEAAAATQALAEANRRLALCHRHLADDRVAFGVPHASGDLCPWDNSASDVPEPDRPTMSLVA